MSDRLRRMRWWDVEAVVGLERELFPDDPWSAAGFWSELAGVPATRYYVVADGAEGTGGVDGIVGYAGLMAVPPEADVQTVAVRPDRQGRGLGGLLVDALVAEARRRGCTRLMLEVREDNAAARALYDRHGFDAVAVRRDYYGQGLDAIVLRLGLGAAS